MPRCVLVIPEYNEARTIIDVLERAHPYADLTVVVDDGSTDNSGQMVRDWTADHPDVILLSLRENQGMSGALMTGFAYVIRLWQEGELHPDDVVVNIDADGQHIPEEIPRALAHMAETRADVVLGRRNLKGYPWFKWVGNWGLSLWASLLTGFRYYDVECGFRLMKVRVVADMLPFFLGRRYGCAQEIGVITARRGWKIDNSFATQISYYRPGARVRDGITNLRMGLLAFLRVLFGLRHPPNTRVAEALDVVTPTLSKEYNQKWPQSS